MKGSRIMKRIGMLALVVALLTAIIPASALAAGYLEATGARVNVRSGPGVNYSSLYTLVEGETATYTGSYSYDSNGTKWYKVQYDSFGTGWVSEKYSVVYSDLSYVQAEGGSVNIRRTPNLTGADLGTMPSGATATYLGQTSTLLGASSAALLNALKVLGGIPDEIKLIAPAVIEPIQDLKVNHMGNRNPRLHTNEVLIALAICAATNPTAATAIDQIDKLRGCEAHSSVILSQVDEDVFMRLGINITFDPVYQTNRLYHN